VNDSCCFDTKTIQAWWLVGIPVVDRQASLYPPKECQESLPLVWQECLRQGWGSESLHLLPDCSRLGCLKPVTTAGSVYEQSMQ